MSAETLKPPCLLAGPLRFDRERYGGLPENNPRNSDGHPVTERWRECCRYYRFNEALPLDLLRCGLCLYYREDSGGEGDSDAVGICLCENNGRESK